MWSWLQLFCCLWRKPSNSQWKGLSLNTNTWLELSKCSEESFKHSRRKTTARHTVRKSKVENKSSMAITTSISRASSWRRVSTCWPWASWWGQFNMETSPGCTSTSMGKNSSSMEGSTPQPPTSFCPALSRKSAKSMKESPSASPPTTVIPTQWQSGTSSSRPEKSDGKFVIFESNIYFIIQVVSVREKCWPLQIGNLRILPLQAVVEVGPGDPLAAFDVSIAGELQILRILFTSNFRSHPKSLPCSGFETQSTCSSFSSFVCNAISGR